MGLSGDRTRARSGGDQNRAHCFLPAVQATPEDLTDAVEAIVGVVRERADVRWREGQPWFAVEFHYAPAGAGELEWSMCVVCEPQVVRQLDAALASSYPGVRVGYDFVAEPQPVLGTLRPPAHIERLRKHKRFVFALDRDRAGGSGAAVPGAPIVELIAQLPDRYRDAVRMSELEGLSQQAVADRLHLSLSGAKSRVQRGRAKLRQILDACCSFEFDRRGNLLDCQPHPDGSPCRQCDSGKT